MSTPAKRPLAARGPGSSLQIVFGAILAISLLLAINFSGRIAAGRQIEAKRDDLQESLSTLQAQATALQATLNYVNSDAFIERWAHREGKMVRSGEVLIVPVPGPMTPQPAPTPFVALPAAEERVEEKNLKLWWQLFFDSPVPAGGN